MRIEGVRRDRAVSDVRTEQTGTEHPTATPSGRNADRSRPRRSPKTEFRIQPPAASPCSTRPHAAPSRASFPAPTFLPQPKISDSRPCAFPKPASYASCRTDRPKMPSTGGRWGPGPPPAWPPSGASPSSTPGADGSPSSPGRRPTQGQRRRPSSCAPKPPVPEPLSRARRTSSASPVAHGNADATQRQRAALPTPQPRIRIRSIKGAARTYRHSRAGLTALRKQDLRRRPSTSGAPVGIDASAAADDPGAAPCARDVGAGGRNLLGSLAQPKGYLRLGHKPAKQTVGPRNPAVRAVLRPMCQTSREPRRQPAEPQCWVRLFEPARGQCARHGALAIFESETVLRDGRECLLLPTDNAAAPSHRRRQFPKPDARLAAETDRIGQPAADRPTAAPTP
jgi:hypothetical protein